jgi:hypothetical protein
MKQMAWLLLLLLLLLLQSTYVEHVYQHCQAIRRNIHCVNLGVQQQTDLLAADLCRCKCSCTCSATGLLQLCICH